MHNLIALLASITLMGNTASAVVSPIWEKDHLVSEHQISLNTRYSVPSVNDVFRDNILLTLAYADGLVRSKDQINWNDVRKPFVYRLTLEPGQTFAFHDQVLAKYSGKVEKTTNAHFIYPEGFKSDGYLTGDGVCHLASLMYWAAKDANLYAEAPTNHDFEKIEGVPREFGVSIFSYPNQAGDGASQNLYIINTDKKPVEFRFTYNGDLLDLSVYEV